MKNILVISGSPRRHGNTARITRIVEEKMSELGDYAFEHLSLKDLHLAYCKGCLLCMKKGEEFCPCKDDSLMLRDKMLDTHGIIFASPVYVHTITALMKNFFDRFAYLCHRMPFRDKASMIIVTTELSGAKETLKYLRLASFASGLKLSAALGVVYPGFEHGGVYKERVLRQISKAAHDFHTDLFSGHRKILFSDLLFFNLMKTKISLHQNAFPADYHYWEKQGWLERDFYTENNIPRFKSTVARTLVRLKAGRLLKSAGLEHLSKRLDHKKEHRSAPAC